LSAHPATGTQSAAVAASPLGLSGADFVAIVLVLVALVGVSVVTTRLVRRSR
jgi:hypothetical protein